MHTTHRRSHVACLVLLLLTTVGGCNAQGRREAVSDKEEALRGLRTSGVISEQEYQQRLAQLHGASQAAARKPAVADRSGHVWHMRKGEFRTMIGYDALPQWGIAARPQREVTAFSMLVPVDWQFNAGIDSRPMKDCAMTFGRIQFAALSPDKQAGMFSVPASVTLWTSDRMLAQSIMQDNQQRIAQQVCNLEQPMPLQQKIVQIASSMSKDLTPTGPMQPIPGASEKLTPMVARLNQQLEPQGSHLDVQLGRLPLRSKDGSDGYLTVMQTVRTDRLPSGGIVASTDYPLQVASFAPAGKYADYETMFASMLDSATVNPEYSQNCLEISANVQSIKMQTKSRLNQIQQQMALDNMQAARQQAAIRQDVSNYRSHVMSSVAANRSAALEHSSQQFSLYMGDQAQYHDPTTGGIVQLPSGAGHVWASQTGNTSEYILTDSPSYNPNGQVGSASWTQMQAVR